MNIGDNDEADEEPAFVPIALPELFNVLLESKRYADVTLLVGAKKTPLLAHRLVLATASPLLGAMLYPNKALGQKPHVESKEQPMLTIEWPDVHVDTARNFLQLVYTDELELEPSELQATTEFAKRYQVDKLALKCSEYMELGLNMDNCFELFCLGPQLLGDKTFGLKFISENISELLETDGFRELPELRLRALLECDSLAAEEIEIFNAVRKWGAAQCKAAGAKPTPDEQAKVLKALLPLIRFPVMNVADIAKHVSTSQLLDQKQLLELYNWVSLDEKTKRGKKSQWTTKEREGGFFFAKSKILTARKHAKAMKKIWGKQYKKIKSCTLLYHGKRDGLNAQSFQARCNNKGSNITFIQSKNTKNIFGGYTQDSWTGNNQYGQRDAFLFRVQGKDGSAKPFRTNPSTTSNRIYCHTSYGPTFGGGHDMYVAGNMTSNSNYTNPSTYRTVDRDVGGNETFTNQTLAGSYNFTVADIPIAAELNRWNVCVHALRLRPHRGGGDVGRFFSMPALPNASTALTGQLLPIDAGPALLRHAGATE
jgi:hypothetical protein